MPATIKKPLRIGLIGAGWVTQHHLKSWAQISPDAKVIAIADPNLEQAKIRANEFGIEHVFADAADMLAHGGLDAIDIAAPRQMHVELVQLVASSGLPVLCQKPLAPTYDQACSLVAEVQNNTRLMVHENWRFRAYYRQISTWLKEERIGTVVQAQMSLLTSGLIADADGRYPAIDRQPFIATLDRALVMEILIHHIDSLRFLLGDLRLIHARLGRGCSGMQGEDRASIVFENAQGATVTLMSNLRVWGEPAGKPDELLLMGERGSIRLSGDSLECLGAQPAQVAYDLAQCYSDSYTATIRHFVDRLADGLPFETRPEDNLQTLRLVEEIYAFQPDAL
ncbi:MviM Predicted dehydrogenases and related proteins [Burkholderiaceae bacterium]